MYAAFIERNEWEGETWRFYIPTDDNEEAIGRLREHLEMEAATDEFDLSHEEFDDDEVRVLVDHTSEGYMAAHQRLEGLLLVEVLLSKHGEDLSRALYKGGIRDFVED
jgi:hypothetical protein